MNNLKELKLAFNKFERIMNIVGVNRYERLENNKGIGCLMVCLILT